MGVHIEGKEQLLQEIQQVPINADKVVKKAMQETSRAVAKDIRSAMPNKTFKKAIKSVVKAKDNVTLAYIGMFRAKDNWSWMKAYWSNFGTLSNRDPSHRFTAQRKGKSAAWSGGIRPKRFFEKATDGKDRQWEDLFKKTLEKKISERKMDGK